MKLSEMGERKIIKEFEKIFGDCPSLEAGIGDDAAVMKFSGSLAISTDMIFQSTHIPEEMTPYQIGKYAVNVNLSDIASMGARPLGLVFSFGLPGNLDEEFVGGIARGIKHAAEQHKCCVIGGDTKEAGEIVISGTAFGRVMEKPVLRSGAKERDLICVTGEIGSAAAGFYCLIKNLDIGKESREFFLKSALEPEARSEEGQILAGYASSCMDISDGLAFSLHEIATQSGVGFEIQEELIPRNPDLKKVARLAGVHEKEIIFHKGGEFELLFTVSEPEYNELKGRIKIYPIGKITKKEKRVVLSRGKRYNLEPRGFESFSTRFS